MSTTPLHLEVGPKVALHTELSCGLMCKQFILSRAVRVVTRRAHKLITSARIAGRPFEGVSVHLGRLMAGLAEFALRYLHKKALGATSVRGMTR